MRTRSIGGSSLWRWVELNDVQRDAQQRLDADLEVM
jgi:hypothetical protein